MIESIHPVNDLFLSMEKSSRSLIVYFGISTALHILLFSAFVIMPGRLSNRKILPSVIDVNLVSVSEKIYDSEMDDHKGKKTGVVEPDQTVSKKSKKEFKTTSKKDIKAQDNAKTAKKKKKIKRSLKKRTFKSSKVVKSAIERLGKKVEHDRPDSVIKAIESLKKEAEKGGLVSNKKKGRQAMGSLENNARSGSNKLAEIIDNYRVEIAYQIQKNWAFSESIAGNHSDLTAELAFKVMPDGRIKDIWFDKRSGNKYLDESALKAVIKSNPVRPHPKGVELPVVIVGLRFGPKGLK